MLIDCPAGNSHKNWEPEELKTASSILNPMNKLNNDDDDDNDIMMMLNLLQTICTNWQLLITWYALVLL